MIPRFYCPLPLALGQTFDLPVNVAHHLFVLRLKIGDLLTLFNGEGGQYTASLTHIDKKHAQVTIKVFEQTEVELPYAITLAQALPEASKMDWIIEKSVELGATAFQPLITQRSVPRLNEQRAEKKQAHWQGIIQAAAEQCGRNRLARLAPILSFSEWIQQHDLHRRIVLMPNAEQSLSEWLKHQPAQALTLLIGPEGGFNPDEQQALHSHHILFLSLGPRVLRTETAGLTALATINAFWEHP